MEEDPFDDPGLHLTSGGEPASSPPPTALGVDPPSPRAVVLQRLVVFNPLTGNPEVLVTPAITRNQISDLILAASSSLYEDPTHSEPQYAGWTNLEVMIHKRVKFAAATGDDDAVERILDRLIGKPKQTSESVRVNLTYEDTLKDIARQERLNTAREVFAPQAPTAPRVPVVDPFETLVNGNPPPNGS